MRLALSLIIFFAGLSLTGALLPQVPSGITAGSAEYTWWLQHAAYPLTGAWTGILALLQLFDVFHSIWFVAAGILLIVNILFCTGNRLRLTLKAIGRKPAGRDDAFYAGLPVREEFEGTGATSERLMAGVTATLKKRGYRLSTDNSGGNIGVAAVKNRFSPFGTALSHLSIILLIMGFIVGSVSGFENHAFIVSEGDKLDVGFGTGLSLYLDSFTDEYWEDGVPKDFASDVVIFRDSDEIARGTIRVNYPLDVGGIRFYQSFFGPAAAIRVKTADGKELFRGSVPLAETVETGGIMRPIGGIDVPGTGLHAYFIGPVSTLIDPVLKTGQTGIEVYQGNTAEPTATGILQQGTPQNLAGVEFTYLGRGQFSGFIVKRDPGTWLIWLASALFILGVFTVFYFPRREVSTLIRNSPDGVRLTVGASSSRLNSAAEIKQILQDIQASLDNQTDA